MRSHKPIVGVMGGSAVPPDVEHTAAELGRKIALRGWTLLTGGRNCGVMAAATRGAKQAGGNTIGILPDRNRDNACPDLDYAILTGLGDARNLVNVLSSDVVIACSGAAGTASEVALALKNARRVILLGFPVSLAFKDYRASGLLTVADSVDDAIAQAADALAQDRDDRHN